MDIIYFMVLDLKLTLHFTLEHSASLHRPSTLLCCMAFDNMVYGIGVSGIVINSLFSLLDDGILGLDLKLQFFYQ